jgi:nucleoid DNA-binding protein
MAKSSIQVLARYISEKRGVPQRDAEHFVKSFFEIISETLQSGESLVKIKGFGTFKIVDVKDRESVDVNTGERIVIEGRSKISFIPDNVMKELVNKPFSQFETVVVND